MEEYVHRSLENARLQSFDLMQFHTWQDEWLRDDRWFYKPDDMRSQRLINAIGISLNRWEPWNGVRAVKTGQIDSVQVIYNIFDQNPEDDQRRRTTGYPIAPAQIPACGFLAPGSSEILASA